MGSETYVYLNTGQNSFISRVDAHRRIAVGDELELALDIDKAHIFDAYTEAVVA